MSVLLPITQETRNYFNIYEKKLTHCMLEEYVKNAIMSAENKKHKALEIWDFFVPNNDFSDVPQRFVTADKLQEYRNIIINSNDPTHYMFAFKLIGLSPFWTKISNYDKSN